MNSSKPLYDNHTSLVKQVLASMIQNRPFDIRFAASATSTSTSTATVLSPNQLWSVETIFEVLRSIPRCFFHSNQSNKLRKGVLVLGPAPYRDPQKVKLGLDKAVDFYYWVEAQFDFTHTEMTCREMACVLAKGNKLKDLWEFFTEMAKRGIGNLVTTTMITCLIKVLGEEGLVNEALATFYRMKQFHCKPDVYAYNTIIYMLCRVGNFRKARFLLEQMELPGFRCPPGTFTYTIFISSYCKYNLQTGCKKAIMRRLWEANHWFRLMLFKGFIPDVVTYNFLIDGCCKTYRIERALELFDDMIKRGCLPNRVTYNSFIRYCSVVNENEQVL